ncbi:hypothetical protein SAMN05446037_10169 [Anaerovirgula multivorans]|uniref:Uncharacterized protein n=1 Tax=Anaerovirgula multivorans TaxID=312168 RepID=A0A239GB40_9FIRM|nr:hypothetical protein SAMN05446037_10169 [Anaerovirgula multivorans]
MSETSVVMMVLVLGFYGIGFIMLLNKAFKSKDTK